MKQVFENLKMALTFFVSEELIPLPIGSKKGEINVEVKLHLLLLELKKAEIISDVWGTSWYEYQGGESSIHTRNV